MKDKELVGMTITAEVYADGKVYLVGETNGRQVVWVVRSIWLAKPMETIRALKLAFGYGPAPKPSIVRQEPPQVVPEAAPFVPQTVAEQDEAEPEFEMSRGWLDRVTGLASGTPADKVEGWDKP